MAELFVPLLQQGNSTSILSGICSYRIHRKFDSRLAGGSWQVEKAHIFFHSLGFGDCTHQLMRSPEHSKEKP